MASPQTAEFKVAMTCDGCARAVRAVLAKTEGVENVDIDVPAQKVVVTGRAAPDILLEAIRKTGKATTLVSHSSAAVSHQHAYSTAF